MPTGSTLPLFALALALPAATAPDAPAPQPPEPRVTIAQLTIREHIVIRLPRMPAPTVAQPASTALATTPVPVRWREKKGPHCVAAGTLSGAMLSAPRQLDLLTAGGKRLRAKLGGACQPLDFYNGFYLRPGGDGMVCAGRDAIRVRSGGACDIDQFRVLVPASAGK